MDGRSITEWARRNITERRMAVAMLIAGMPLTLVSVALYVLPGPGFPFLVVGLSLLITGLAMLGAARKSP
ncbi:hypothetical protein [Streptomyces sp. NPDC093093]|uniref:hypothetical protein n=1 Tax=Streptomyces sp. NPDC093093 TaxID=3366025 RepID=UPI00382DADBB